MLTFKQILRYQANLQSYWTTGVERCGIIDREGKIVECANIADDPTDNFEFDPDDLKDAIATWHTHPFTSANLSIPDFYFFKDWPELTHFVISEYEVRCFIVSEGLVHFVEQEEDHPAWVSGRSAQGTD